MIAHGSECIKTHNASYHVFAKDVGIHVTQNNFMFFVLSHFKHSNNASTLYLPKIGFASTLHTLSSLIPFAQILWFVQFLYTVSQLQMQSKQMNEITMINTHKISSSPQGPKDQIVCKKKLVNNFLDFCATNGQKIPFSTLTFFIKKKKSLYNFNSNNNGGVVYLSTSITSEPFPFATFKYSKCSQFQVVKSKILGYLQIIDILNFSN